MSEFVLEQRSAPLAAVAVADACVMTSEFEYCEEDFMTYSSRRSSTNEISPLIEETVECGSEVGDNTSMVVCFSDHASSSFNPSPKIFKGTGNTYLPFKFYPNPFSGKSHIFSAARRQPLFYCGDCAERLARLKLRAIQLWLPFALRRLVFRSNDHQVGHVFPVPRSVNTFNSVQWKTLIDKL